MILVYIIAFTLIGSILSLFGSLFLLLKQKITEGFSQKLISFAAGALIATAFLDLLPEASELKEGPQIFLFSLLGFVSFFFAEKYITLFHYHPGHGEKPSTLLVLAGDGVHDIIDGVAIAVAFLVSIPLGIVTTIAVASHEIPQEIADMGVLLANGLPKARALIFNFLSAITALIGAIAAFLLAGKLEGYLYIFLAVAAGHFIYIAASDLIPELHEKSRGKRDIGSILIFVLGILTIYLSSLIFEG